ncbi:hypothetical protein F4819DRAFT_504863 [Hypoxylon fuscum]|nr:hypothetical protein F4819DRAFT_504863 [Hypoxylon fuscum]
MAASQPNSTATTHTYEQPVDYETIELDELIDRVSGEEPYIERRMMYGWRPKYLRRRVVIAFNVIFTLHVVILEALNRISIQRQGFVFAGVDVFNACRLVIPTVLTLILAFWLRFEYQACRYLPWMILARQPEKLKPIHDGRNDAARTIALDYASMWTPNAMIAATKNKHFLVLSALITSMLLRVQMSVEVGLQDIFLDRVDLPFSSIMDSRPYRLESGNWTTQLEYPQYVIPGVALQRFEEDVLAEMENSTALTVIVDGVVVESSCEASSVSIMTAENGTTTFAISPHRRIPSRSIQIDNIYPDKLLVGSYIAYYWEDSSYYNSSSEPFFMAMAISGNRDADNASFQTTSLACTLDVQVYPFEVVIESTKLSAVRRPGAGATRSIPGGLLDYMWRSYPNPTAIYPDDAWIGSGICGGLVTGDIMDTEVTAYFSADLIPFKVGSWLLKNGPLNGSEFADPSILEDVMRLYHSVYGSFVAHYDFRRPVQSSTNGTITLSLSRLGMQPYISQAMACIFGLIMVLTLPLLWQVSPRDGFVPFKPHTLAGMAILLSRSDEFLGALNRCGHQPIKVLMERTKGAYHTTLIHHSSRPLYPSFQLQRLREEESNPTEIPPRQPKDIDWYRPWTLHLASRILSLLLTVGFLATLVALMQSSLRHEGLGDAFDNYSHYMWTSLPSVLFVGLSAYFGSCDFELRSLAPFVLLSSKAVTYSEGLTLSFVDQSAVRALFKSLKRRHLVVVLSTSIVLLCSLLPIFTASLFAVQMGSKSKPIMLQQVEWFTSGKFELQETNMADLVFNANLSYPQWTFEDIVIPQYQVAAELATPNNLQPNSVITTQLRAVTAVLDCDYSTSTGLNVSIGMYGKEIICNPSGLIVCPLDASQSFGLDPLVTRWLCNMDNSTEGWPPLMYAWGKCQDNQGFSSWGSDSYATILVCNETFEEVEIQTTLFGPDLEMRESHPPALIGSSRKPITLDLSESVFQPNLPGYNIPNPYGSLIDDQGNKGSFFGTLTSSRYAIPDEWLGEISKKEDVIAALKKVHGIVRAQMLRGSTGAWRYLNDTATNASSATQEKSPLPSIDGEIWQTLPRVIQSETATYVLISLLAVIFILNAFLVWLSETHGYRRAVPKPPGTIVAVASLFANSTLFGNLPPNAQWATHQKLEQHFQGKRFRMGWYADRIMNDGAVFTIGVVNGETHT